MQDLKAVAAYITSTYGYEIELVVGHSRGSIVGLRWIATTEIGRQVPAYINVSARYRMRVSLSSNWEAQLLVDDLFSCALFLDLANGFT